MRAEGVEPPRSFEQWHLKPSCLPFHHARGVPILPSSESTNLSAAPHRFGDMRSAEQFGAAKQLIAAGLNDCAISRQIGVPRTTVRDWRRRPAVRSRDPGAPCGVAHDFAQLPASAYAYTLGMYLGDGSISRNRRIWRLRITLDKKYPAIIDRCRQAIEILMPGQRTFRSFRSIGHACCPNTALG
jgi:hypothetical protein